MLMTSCAQTTPAPTSLPYHQHVTRPPVPKPTPSPTAYDAKLEQIQREVQWLRDYTKAPRDGK